MRKIVILETECSPGDCEALHIESARYQDSEPFSGTFRVFDLNDCCTVDPDTGKRYADVFCHWGHGCEEDEMLRLEICDPIEFGTMGWDGEVVARIAFEDEGS